MDKKTNLIQLIVEGNAHVDFASQKGRRFYFVRDIGKLALIVYPMDLDEERARNFRLDEIVKNAPNLANAYVLSDVSCVEGYFVYAVKYCRIPSLK